MPRSNRQRDKSAVNSESRWTRYALLAACLGLLAAGLAVRFLPLLDPTGEKFTSGMLLKVGVVVGIVWLAAPHLERIGWHKLRGSALILLVIVLVLLAIRPRLGAIVGAGLLAVSLLFSVSGWIRRWTRAKPD